MLLLHAPGLHRQAFETDDPAGAMFMGPSTTAVPLEIGVVSDGEGVAITRALAARRKFLEGWWTK